MIMVETETESGGKPAPHQLLAALQGFPLEGVYLLEEVGSTQDEARRKLKEKRSVLVLAERQRRGRGRAGQAWESPAGGLWFSLGFRLPRPRRTPGSAASMTASTSAATASATVPLSLLALLAGVAAARALRALGFAAGLKWPNDILVDGKKVGGILVELEPADAAGSQWVVVIGIGINVNIPEGELQGRLDIRAGTLMAIAGRPLDRGEVLLRILREFFPLWDLWQEGRVEPVLRGWEELNLTLNREVGVLTTDGRRIRGTAVGLDRDGALLIRTPDGHPWRVSEGHLAFADRES